jgi:hypothetical protein
MSAQNEPTEAESSDPAQTGGPEQPDVAGQAISEQSDSSIGKSYVGVRGVIIISFIIIILLILTTYALVAAWPHTGPSPTSLTTTRLLGIRLILDNDQQLFVIVALAGAIGGLIHCARSLYWYAGNRVLRRSWLLMYLFLPFIGATLAIVFYIILRGGLIAGTSTTAQVNYFGVTAISALVGLFSPEAAEKLKQIFSTLLAPAETGRDRLLPTVASYVRRVEPTSGPPGTLITIDGQNLLGSTAVLFHGARAPVITVSQSEITAQVPHGASTGPIRLAIGDQIANVPGIFRVES